MAHSYNGLMGISTWFQKRASQSDAPNTAALLQSAHPPVTLAYRNGKPASMADIGKGGMSGSFSVQTVNARTKTGMSVPTMTEEQSPGKKALLTPNFEPRSPRFWRKIPQLVNRFWYLLKSQPTRHEDYLDYDPFYLRVFTNQRYNAFGEQFYVETLKNDKQLLQRLNQKEIDFETFKLILEQVPGVRTIEFSGRGEPLLNAELFDMVQYARQFNGAETIVVTNGHLLKKCTKAILDSPLSQLCISLHGHKPSTYHQMSGLDAHNFVPIVESIRYLVERKKATHSSLKIMLTMTVDVHTFRNIPEMVVFAHELGVDGIVLNNYLPTEAEKPSERTLFSDQHIVREFLFAVESKLSHFQNLEVTLPTLLDRDMSGHRYCQEAYTTVAVDGSCTVYPCSRQLLVEELGTSPKIWEPDFWNHETYHHLRNIHARSTVFNDNQPEVPLVCQNCPRNLSCAK